MGLVFVKMSSAVSRAILKPVYQFGMPNTDPKLPGFWCKLSSLFVVTEPQEQCFELFRMENSQKIFQGFVPGHHWGGLTALPPHSPDAQWFFSSLYSSKNQDPQKIAAYETDVHKIFFNLSSLFSNSICPIEKLVISLFFRPP